MAAPDPSDPPTDTAGLSGVVAHLAPEDTGGPRLGRELDAVLFDAGGVIVVPDPLSTGPALAPFGATADLATLIRAHYVGMRAHAGSTAEGDAVWLDYLRAHVAAAGVPAERADEALAAFVRVFGHRTWRFPLLDTITAMERMRDGGTPLGVVSNAVGQVEDVLRHQSCCQVGPGGGVEVDVVVDSAVVGIEKPDPGVFAPALEVMAGFGVEPGRVGYVGDSLRYDVAGARAAGLVPLLLDPYDLHGDLDLGPGAHRIASVHELLPAPARPEAAPAEAPQPEAD
ncbi:MAG TPA: HAD family hydrolase [Iamia sp.]|nr:HAD family hydrolase [Iamia sp.]